MVENVKTTSMLDVVLPSLTLSAVSPSSIYGALEDCFGKSRGAQDMSIPPRLSLFHNGEQRSSPLSNSIMHQVPYILIDYI